MTVEVEELKPMGESAALEDGWAELLLAAREREEAE